MAKNAQQIATRQAIFAASPAEMVLPHCAAAQNKNGGPIMSGSVWGGVLF